MAWTDLPLDLLPLILAHLPNTSDWLACALVSSAADTMSFISRLAMVQDSDAQKSHKRSRLSRRAPF